MADTTTVFNCMGVPLDELPVSVPRGDNVTRTVNADRGFFELPVMHPKATLRNLRNGNIVLTQSNLIGIRPWAALIQEPEPTGTELSNGQLSIKLRGTEYLLASRYTDSSDTVTGTPGSCVAQLAYIARRGGFLPISTETNLINMGGAVIGPLEYNNANIYEAINKIASDSDAYWYMAPTITPDNKLLLKIVFTYKRTRVFPVPLNSTGNNANLSIKKINQSGELWNHVRAYGRSPTPGAVVEYEERNYRSIGYYENVYTKVIPALEETTVDGLMPIVKAALAAHSFPPLRIDGIITRAPFPVAGDICTVYLGNHGALITARRGAIIKMTVEGTFYAPLDKSLAVRLVEVIV